jgi:UrcA family protein
MISVTKSISTWFFAVGLAAVASGAPAGEQPRLSLDPVVTVHFADLNTSSPEGSPILYGRISEAAFAVCSGGGLVPERALVPECYRATVDHVVTKLNLPALTALHVARTRRTGSSFQASNR